MRMASRYGHAWVSQYGASPAGIAAAEWRSTLAGLTPEQILSGFAADKLRGSEWPPSSTLFHAMCHGIPTLAEVAIGFRREYHRTLPAAGFDRLVYNFLDTCRWRLAPFDRADKMLRDAYSLAREHVLAGGDIPAQPVALIEKPAPKEYTPASPEVVAAHLAKMAALLKISPEGGEAA